MNPVQDQRKFLVACEQDNRRFSELYWNLVHEEWCDETEAARKDNNKAAVFDGLLDTVYVLAGLLNTHVSEQQLPLTFTPDWLDGSEMQNWSAAICAVHEVLSRNHDEPAQALFASRAIRTVWALGESLGLPMEKGWDEVHRSNMAKVDAVTGRVHRRDDGKILKPANWVGPNLKAILEGKVGNYTQNVTI